MAKTTSIKQNNRPKVKDLKLNSLLEVTKAINNNYSTEQLLTLFQNILKNELNIGKLALFSHINSGKWEKIISYGTSKEIDNIDVEKELKGFKEISTIDLSSKDVGRSFEIIIPVYHKSEPLAYLLIGDLEDKLEVSPAIKHLPFVQTITNIITVAIENKKLAKENLKQAALSKELELASEMQSMLFPNSFPDDKNLQIAALYQPHQRVGGDYYDYIRLNENEIVFCMADVSGKGVAAALLMSNFQANLRVLLNHTKSLTELVNELNTKVMASAKGEKFITFFIAKYNIVNKMLRYVNAGHNPPILFDGKNVSYLQIGCTGLGMFDELMNVKEGLVHINPPSTILCYTDGVVEIENENKDDFGTENLKQVLVRNAGLTMNELNNKIISSINEFKGEMPYVDDVALFSCKIF